MATASTRSPFAQGRDTLWVDDTRVDEIIRKIVEIARTGRMGDGKIMVLPVALCADAIAID